MKPPCEMVVWYVIPAVRSELAKELLKLGMKQKEISKLLDITQPAVSQYISDKRGHGVKFNEEIQALVKEFAEDLSEGRATERDIVPRTCQICKMVKSEDIMCQLHKEKDNIPFNCSACLSNKL
jgi:hypothetical protein